MIFHDGAKQKFPDIYLDHFYYQLYSRKTEIQKKACKSLAKIQSAREVSHDITLMDNCQTF